ncbi:MULTISPECIES: hypothetical protein [Halomonas]|jgi:DNA-directed RNA polymerase specialized sigma24 family protein|uniref:hypothetical protein n=1 Tax=Halomonas TaxID=2745 RepID=UPI0020B6D1A9|nr:hypothetical protein [Halomonas sp. 3H]
MPRTLAVITGDIIDSRRIQPAEALSRALDAALEGLTERFGACTSRYRGDGFQLALAPQHAMEAAVLLRASLIRHSSREQRWDARLAVAVGPADGWTPQQGIAEASAPPFVASGLALDALPEDQHLVLNPGAPPSGCLALLVRYLDEMIEGWTPAAAEVVAQMLCHADSQQALANRLGISQPAVHKRLRTARWPLLQETLAYLRHRLTDEEPAP